MVSQIADNNFLDSPAHLFNCLTQQIMCEQLEAEISEVKSIVRMVQSQFDTSMWEFIKEDSV